MTSKLDKDNGFQTFRETMSSLSVKLIQVEYESLSQLSQSLHHQTLLEAIPTKYWNDSAYALQQQNSIATH